MKKYLLMLMMSAVLCFGMAGCGGGEEPAAPEPEEPTETELMAESVAGDWKCVDISMEDNGTKIEKNDLEELYGMKADKMAHLTAYGDGTGEFTFLEEATPVTWEESDGGYIIKLAGSDGEQPEGDVMKAVLKDNQLMVTFESTYDNDGAEAKTVMSFVFEYQGKTSSLLGDWDLQLNDEEVLVMSNFMAAAEFIVVDGNVYGSFGGKEIGKGTFSVAKVKDGDAADVADSKVIAKNSAASYLTEHGGYIYAILNWDKIIRVKAGETKAETLYEGACDTLHIRGEKIYFADEKYRLCSMELDGSNVTTVIDQADMYYTYVLPNDMVVYQNDPDNESLHIYDLKTGEDVKLNDAVSYSPIIHGDYLYYTSPTDNEEEFTFHRIDLYTGEIQDAPCIVYNSEFIIENGKFVFSSAGMPTFAVSEWDVLDLSAYGGLVVEARYSDGHIRVVSDSNGEIYIKNNEFNDDGKTSIGFNCYYIVE